MHKTAKEVPFTVAFFLDRSCWIDTCETSKSFKMWHKLGIYLDWGSELNACKIKCLLQSHKCKIWSNQRSHFIAFVAHVLFWVHRRQSEFVHSQDHNHAVNDCSMFLPAKCRPYLFCFNVFRAMFCFIYFQYPCIFHLSCSYSSRLDWLISFLYSQHVDGMKIDKYLTKKKKTKDIVQSKLQQYQLLH